MIGTFTDRILWQRAKDFLKRYNPTLIGVAGGFDKTLTREAIALALGKQENVRAIDTDTTHIRELALAILGVKKPNKTSAWWRLLIGSRIQEAKTVEPTTIVLEVAATSPGDIDTIARELPFSIAVIMNTASTRLDLFGDKPNVAHELLSLGISLPSHGTAILNADDPLVAGMRGRIRNRIITFGKDPNADIRLIRADRIGVTGFTGEVAVNSQRFEFSAPHIVGRHQISSLLAALAVAFAQKKNIRDALYSLRGLTPPPGHLSLVTGKNNALLIDDSHDASFESMMASLKTLSALPGEMIRAGSGNPRRIAILGDVTGLGAHTKAAHVAIGQAVTNSADMFIAVGENMRHAQAVILKSGNIDTHHFDSSRDVGKWLTDYLHPQDIILIKGSREMKMKTIVEVLREK